MIMARKKNGFDASVLLKYADQLQEAGGDKALKWGVATSMETAKRQINIQLEKRLQPGNLPAGGKYSTGDTAESIDRQYRTQWNGNIATLPLGFDMSKSGLASIMLLYGTPRMKPVPGLNDALKGKVARRIVRERQEEGMRAILERLGK